MDRILVLSYREAGEDYCRGCLMDATSASFDKLDTTSKDDAVQFLAKMLLTEKTTESGLAYCKRDNYVYVNGVAKDTPNEEGESAAEKHSKSLAAAIILEAQRESERLLEAYNLNKRQEEEAEKVRAAKEQRQHDLAQLANLKKKLGVT